MKLTVDIPEKDYKFIRDTYKETGLAFIPPAIKCECAEAVYNGTPYEERKTGKWIRNTNGRGGHECNQCNEYAPSTRCGTERLSPYCPNCGVKMEVDE